MGFCLGSMYNLPKFNPFTGHCRQLLSPRFSVLFVDGKGVKQSVADKLKLPDKPKKPLTPFFRYMQQIRPSIVQQYPKEPLPAISKIISERWESLDQKARADLELQYKKEKELYDCAKLKYENSLTEDQKQAISEERLKVQEAKSKKKLKQKAKEHDRPRRPPSSYVLFSLSRSNSRGNTPVTEWQKELSKEWKNLDQSQKDKYINQAKEKQSVYLKQMQVWEEKMINLGHVDIVRTETLIPKSPSKTKSKK